MKKLLVVSMFCVWAVFGVYTVAFAQTVTPPPTPTMNPYQYTPTPGGEVVTTQMPYDLSCPTGQPLYVGEVTPSVGWNVLCGKCITPLASPTLDWASLSSLVTPSPYVTETAVATRTVTPTATVPSAGYVWTLFAETSDISGYSAPWSYAIFHDLPVGYSMGGPGFSSEYLVGELGGMYVDTNGDNADAGSTYGDFRAYCWTSSTQYNIGDTNAGSGETSGTFQLWTDTQGCIFESNNTADPSLTNVRIWHYVYTSPTAVPTSSVTQTPSPYCSEVRQDDIADVTMPTVVTVHKELKSCFLFSGGGLGSLLSHGLGGDRDNYTSAPSFFQGLHDWLVSLLDSWGTLPGFTICAVPVTFSQGLRVLTVRVNLQMIFDLALSAAIILFMTRK